MTTPDTDWQDGAEALGEREQCAHEYDSLSFKEFPLGTLWSECVKCRAQVKAVWLTPSEMRERDTLHGELVAMLKRSAEALGTLGYEDAATEIDALLARAKSQGGKS